jgi:hypothetical protein
MAKPTKRKRSKSEGSGEMASEVALRSAALAYAKVADLPPTDRRWRRRWRALRLAALWMYADLVEVATQYHPRPARRATRVRA